MTTEWVLMELADALSAPEGRTTAVPFLRAVRAAPLFDVVGYVLAAYQAGFDLFATRADKAWSLTSGTDYVFDLDIRDYHLWMLEKTPVILVCTRLP